MKKKEDLWQYDVSEDVITGNTDHLLRELNAGWNINEPLLKFAVQGCYMLPLMFAIQSNSMVSVKFLVEHGAMLDADPDHAFIYAMRYADEEIIRYVVKKGAQVRVYCKVLNAYDYIIQEKRPEFIMLAIELGLPLIPYALAAFYTEIYRNNYTMVEKLIYCGINININEKSNWNYLGNTPLCHASCYSDEKMVRFLIDHGADPTIPNKSGMRPYLIALKEGKVKNAQLLHQYEPHSEMPDEKLLKKLPKDLLDFLCKGDYKIKLLENNCIEYIKFLSIGDLVEVNFGGRKGILLTCNFENYPDLCLLWNSKKKCVSYYDIEHRYFGDFGVKFQDFISQPELYLKGIFTGEYISND
ncbi:MAG: hypothetical protein K0S61_3713 [Anaerocolumna sp.]|jgi:ankyrin repeat protein|nr:hypothetical protein [Anaerocolumna sp.]